MNVVISGPGLESVDTCSSSLWVTPGGSMTLTTKSIQSEGNGLHLCSPTYCGILYDWCSDNHSKTHILLFYFCLKLLQCGFVGCCLIVVSVIVSLAPLRGSVLRDGSVENAQCGCAVWNPGRRQHRPVCCGSGSEMHGGQQTCRRRHVGWQRDRPLSTRSVS